MKKIQSTAFLSAFAICMTVGALSAQQTNTPAQPTDPQAQQPTAEQPAPPPQAQAPQATAPAPTQPSQAPDQAAQPSASPSAGDSAQPSDATGVQAFSGTIVKSGDRYMLQDEASGQTYDVDHQDEVQKYEGKRVKVHGTLDASGKMIHLQ